MGRSSAWQRCRYGPKQLQQATDRLIIPFGTRRVQAEAGRDVHEQIDMPGEHGIDFEEIFLGNRFAGVPIQFEVTAMPVKQPA